MERRVPNHDPTQGPQNATRHRIVMTAPGLLVHNDPAEIEGQRIIEEAGVRHEDFDLYFDDMTDLWRSVADTMVRDMTDIERGNIQVR